MSGERSTPEEIKQMEEKAEEIMVETKKGDVDLKKMSKERQEEVLDAMEYRVRSDAQLIEQKTATYVVDEGADKPRLHIKEDRVDHMKGESPEVVREKEGEWGLKNFESIHKQNIFPDDYFEFRDSNKKLRRGYFRQFVDLGNQYLLQFDEMVPKESSLQPRFERLGDIKDIKKG